MKKSLFLLLFVFVLFSVNHNPAYSTCFLFDGTYVGTAITTGSDGKKASRPLFIVIANQHIAGFFAPEDQKTHGPTGSSFNLGDLTVSSAYTLSLTTDNNILIKSSDGKVTGKAKLTTFNGGSPSFSGFYNADTTSDFLPGDFLNVGSDGGAVLKFAGSDGKVVHAFGKINDLGEFVQVFPEKEKGPHVSINFDSGSATLEATLNDDSSTTTLNKFVSASCGSTSSSSSSTSSSGAPSNKPALVSSFQDTLNGISSISTTKSFANSKLEVQDLQDAVKLVKYTLLNLLVADCNTQLPKRIAKLSSAIDALRKTTCTSSCVPVLLALDEDNLVIQSKSTVDEGGNGIVDICEQYSQFSGEEPISIAPELKKILDAMENRYKKLRKEARIVLENQNDAESSFKKLARSIKVIRSSLKAPNSVCSLQLLQTDSIKPSINDIDIKVCNQSDITGCKEEIKILIEDADVVDGLIKLDANKNGIVDVCE